MKVWCVHCKATRDAKGKKVHKSKKGKMTHAVNMFEGKCHKCGGAVAQFVK